MRRIFPGILMLLSFGILSTHTLKNDVCNYKLFPIFAGGSKDEYVNTLEYDSTMDYIYVTGKS